MAPAPAERHVLPRPGYVVYFRESEHSYRKPNPKGAPGGKVPSASGISDAMPDKPDGLMRWAVDRALEGVAVLSDEGVVIPTSGEAIAQVLGERGLAWHQHQDEAARRGKDVHRDMLEALARGEDVPSLKRLLPQYRGYGQGTQRAWLDLDPMPCTVDREGGAKIKPRPVVEQAILSLQHGFAGRLDLQAKIPAERIPPPDDPRWGTPPKEPATDDEVWTIDAKTSKRIYPKFHVQVEGYEIGARESEVGRSDRRVILQLLEDGTYRLHCSAATSGDFLAALDMYGRNRRIQRAIDKARKREEVAA